MNIFVLFLLAVGLAADAFAVAVSIGLTSQNKKAPVIAGLYFGAFQAGMPLVGWLIARSFAAHIAAYSHWVAFALLLFIGGKMIYAGIKNEPVTAGNSLSPRVMLPLAVATSIDALAVGVSLALIYVNIFLAVALIGAVTLVLSAVGVRIGSLVGARLQSKAAFIGGGLLILIGMRMLF